MNIRTITLATVAAAAIAASQLPLAGSAHAVGRANGGIWKTTDGVRPVPEETLTGPSEQPSLLLPAVQKIRCASRYC